MGKNSKARSFDRGYTIKVLERTILKKKKKKEKKKINQKKKKSNSNNKTTKGEKKG